MILAKARIVNYDSRIVIYSFIVLATVINYDRTDSTIVNYECKTFIVQATEVFATLYFIRNLQMGRIS
jgi:hypothetical protein